MSTNNKTDMNRFEKLEYLVETCSDEFIKEHLINSLVQWMSEKEFNEFFEFLCNNWDIKQPKDYYGLGK